MNIDIIMHKINIVWSQWMPLFKVSVLLLFSVFAISIFLHLPIWFDLLLPYKDFMSGFIVGILLSFLTLLVTFSGKNKYSISLKETITEGFNNRWFFVFFIIAAVLFIFFTVLDHHEITGLSPMLIIRMLAKGPGAIAGLFLGLITIVGFVFTFAKLNDIRTTINSFPHLVDRIELLAKKATADNPLFIISYTPSIGYISLSDVLWKKYSHAVTNVAQKVKMVCLNDEDLDKWHKQFVDRKTDRFEKVTEANANEATVQAEKIIEIIEAKARIDKDDEECVYRVKLDILPGYYTFFTKEKSIIVCPLFFPNHGSSENKFQIQKVSMLGFETSDRGIVKDLMELFGQFKKSPSE
jgi:hypothetical protein